MNKLFKSLLIIFFILAVLYYIQKPKYEGTVFHGFEKYGNINIYREKDNGIPHIEGESINSVCFG